MKVYSVLRAVPYSGDELLGVFGDREQAVEFIQKFEDEFHYYDFGVLASELGEQIVDVYSQTEWIVQ
jgi:hypothetical protein